MLTGASCQEFAQVTRRANAHRKKHIETVSSTVLKRIGEERAQLVEQGKVLRDQYKDAEQKYFSNLDKYLALSARRNEQELAEGEAKCAQLKQSWARAGMSYAQYLNLFQLSKSSIAAHVSLF